MLIVSRIKWINNFFKSKWAITWKKKKKEAIPFFLLPHGGFGDAAASWNTEITYSFKAIFFLKRVLGGNSNSFFILSWRILGCYLSYGARKNKNSLKIKIIVKKGGPTREFWENPHDKDTIKMIYEDLSSSPEAAPECSQPGVEEGMWGVGAAPCTLICTFLGARAHGQHGCSCLPTREKLAPPPKTGKNPLRTHRRGLKPREFGGCTGTVGTGWDLGCGRKPGGWEEASEWRNVIFLFIFLPHLKVIQGRRHNPGEFCNCDKHGRRFCMEWAGKYTRNVQQQKTPHPGLIILIIKFKGNWELVPHLRTASCFHEKSGFFPCKTHSGWKCRPSALGKSALRLITFTKINHF